MPIYAYRCASCGHSRDVLQKISDPVLTTCPVCGAEQFQKQVTAAGFQLKGSGWYVTDFRGGSSAKAEKSTEPAAGDAKGGEAPKTESKPAESTAAASPAPAPAPAASKPDTPSSAA